MEDNAWQSMYADHVKLLIRDRGGEPFDIQGAGRKGTEQSVGRILGLQPLFEAGRIHFVRGGPGISDAVSELRHWSKKRAKQGRDDICSALSDAPEHCIFPPRPAERNEWTIQDHWDELERHDFATPPRVFHSRFK